MRFATLTRMPTSRLDTILVVGADEPDVRAVMVDPTLRRWLLRWVRRAGRFGSVCSGTFLLAALGLLKGKRVATHWEACEKLARGFPNLSVDANALYVIDGEVWTSAGVPGANAATPTGCWAPSTSVNGMDRRCSPQYPRV